MAESALGHPQRGRTWVDEQVHVCDQGSNTLVTSRKPDDLKAFCEALLTEFAKAGIEV